MDNYDILKEVKSLLQSQDDVRFDRIDMYEQEVNGDRKVVASFKPITTMNQFLAMLNVLGQAGMITGGLVQSVQELSPEQRQLLMHSFVEFRVEPLN